MTARHEPGRLDRVNGDAGKSNTAIWRYELPIVDRPQVTMPRGAQVLPAPPSQRNIDSIEIWAEVTPDDWLTELREFRIVGTGKPKPADFGRFVGTTITHGGRFIWHLYEVADGDF